MAEPPPQERVPEEIEYQIIDEMRLAIRQIRYIRARSEVIGPHVGVSIIIHIHRDRIFRNLDLVNFLFDDDAFKGESANPGLRPTIGENGIFNPENKTYSQLLLDSRRAHDRNLESRLQAARDTQLVQHRATAAINSNELQKGVDTPSAEMKQQLRIHPSNHDSYDTILARAANNPDQIKRVQEARRHDEGNRPAMKAKLRLYERMLDMIEKTVDKFEYTCRGCFKAGCIWRHDGHPPLCDGCLTLYCKLVLSSKAQLRSLHIDTDLIYDKWLKPVHRDGTQYFGPGTVESLINTFIGPSTVNKNGLSNLDATSIDEMKFRFISIVQAMNETRKPMAKYIGSFYLPNDSRYNTGDAVIALQSFHRLAGRGDDNLDRPIVIAQQSFRRLAGREDDNLHSPTFTAYTQKFFSDMFDRDPQVVSADRGRWRRHSRAVFWIFKLRAHHDAYSDTFLKYSYSIPVLTGWHSSFGIEEIGYNASVCDWFSGMIHGCPLELLTTYTTCEERQDNIAKFVYLAAAVCRIMTSYCREGIDICMDLNSIVYARKPGIVGFLPVIVDWLKTNTEVPLDPTVRSMTDVPTPWLVSVSNGFWSSLVATPLIFQERDQTIAYTFEQACMEWAAPRRVVIRRDLLAEELENANVPLFLARLLGYSYITVNNKIHANLDADRHGHLAWISREILQLDASAPGPVPLDSGGCTRFERLLRIKNRH